MDISLKVLAPASVALAAPEHTPAEQPLEPVITAPEKVATKPEKSIKKPAINPIQEPIEKTQAEPASAKNAPSIPTTDLSEPTQTATRDNVATPEPLKRPVSITKPVAVLRKTHPEYPKKARRRELEGTVILLATISPQGHIEKLSLDKSSGHSILDNAATQAVENWTFSPAVVSGEPTRASLTVPVRFSLNNP